jgi:hypothetical protein
VVAFWLVLWLAHAGHAPADQLRGLSRCSASFDAGQARAGGLGRPGCSRLQPGQAIGWRQGFGILLDDFVAAVVHAARHRAGRGGFWAADVAGSEDGAGTMELQAFEPRVLVLADALMKPRQDASPPPRAAPGGLIAAACTGNWPGPATGSSAAS